MSTRNKKSSSQPNARHSDFEFHDVSSNFAVHISVLDKLHLEN